MRNDRDTIAAIVTAQGEGGIAIVRISGASAFQVLDAVFTRRSAGRWEKNRLYYGHVAEGGQFVDEAMAVYMPAPRSYTREDVCEIHCHGGRYAAGKALALALKHGARPAEPGEFTLRAFLNGRVDLSQAEAVMAMISASGEAAARAAARAMDGGLARFVDALAEQLTGLLALIEAGVDFPEEVDEAAAAGEIAGVVRAVLAELTQAADERAARLVREGLAVALVGPPNAGKSSLMNALLKSDRAIVTEVPGTTRDVLSERLAAGGYEITLLDTAGLREAGDAIEREGVRRARRAAESADLVILVLDGSAPEGEAERALLLEADERTLIALNKCDLGVDQKRVGLRVSAKTGEGVDALLQAILARAGAEGAGEARLTKPRHLNLARRAAASLGDALAGLEAGAPLDLLAIDLMAALSELLEITGKNAPDEVIDAVFRNFCVGK